MTTTRTTPFEEDILLREAWAWLEDAGIVSEDDTQMALDGQVTAAQVIANVSKLYEGGWEQFKKDIAPLEKWYRHVITSAPGGRKVICEKSNFGNTRCHLV